MKFARIIVKLLEISKGQEAFWEMTILRMLICYYLWVFDFALFLLRFVQEEFELQREAVNVHLYSNDFVYNAHFIKKRALYKRLLYVNLG